MLLILWRLTVWAGVHYAYQCCGSVLHNISISSDLIGYLDSGNEIPLSQVYILNIPDRPTFHRGS